MTVSVIRVSKDEASRFGIMNVNPDMTVYEFEEKPKNPKSTLASMGIYIFTYKELRQALLTDAKNQNSEHDFGKDIIPMMVAQKKKIFAYAFSGYWRDVGTIDSLWQANMDLLEHGEALSVLQNDALKVFTEDTRSLPQYIGDNAKVQDSLINQGAVIFGKVLHSVIFHDVIIEDGAQVTDCVIMPGAVIRSGVNLKRVIVGPNTKVTESFTSSGQVRLVNK
jgi:glucose-1-phosphate adenylyltransferase